MTNDPEALPVGWIPIREDANLSGSPPFDFAQERMIVVPRNGSQVNEGQFKDRFRGIIRSLIRQ